MEAQREDIVSLDKRKPGAGLPRGKHGILQEPDKGPQEQTPEKLLFFCSFGSLCFSSELWLSFIQSTAWDKVPG